MGCWFGLLSFSLFLSCLVLGFFKYTILAETIPSREKTLLQEDNLSSFLTTKPLPDSKESTFENRCHQANNYF